MSEQPENETPVRVRPALHPLIEEGLKDASYFLDLVEGFGSPLNILFPQIISENIARFQDTFQFHQLSGRIFYTSKPNKSLAVMKQAALEAVSIDVSSETALKQALSAGFAPQRIEVTGPKNLEYLSLAIQQGVIVNVDSLAELQTVVDLHKALGVTKPVPVLVRLCGFSSPGVKFTSQDSTFGTQVKYFSEIVRFLKTNATNLEFLGFSFHLSSGEEERAVALEHSLSLTLEALRAGLKPIALDIGGGYRINYAADQAEWSRYIVELKKSVLGVREPLSWNDSGLGFRNEDGVLKGAPNFLDHYVGVSSDDQLCQLLSRPLPSLGNLSAGRILSESMLQLFIEPGRGLLDQLGLTLARVNFVKESAFGETLVGLDMNRSNLHATQQKLLTEPIILYRDPSKGIGSVSARGNAKNGLYYVGNLCVSYDLIQYQKTFPEKIPTPGDVVVFANTAAYLMDFVESHTLQQQVAEKVAVYKFRDSFHWCKDGVYNPLALRL